MKKVLTILALLFSINTYAQKISLNQLINLANKNLVEAEDMLLNLGFKFESADDEGNQLTSYSYSSDENTSINKGFVLLYMFGKSRMRTAYFTTSKTFYQILKKSVDSSDFIYEESQKTENGIKHSYYSRDDKTKIELTTTNYGFVISVANVDVLIAEEVYRYGLE
ncbi:hypothetical protein [Sphingobacterium cellulitidis]|uniref:DUF4367 domain-containing protein n=1 Tax=Sphingobacterium cellulitidis TaxID=1768011 RepID=A0A8H9KV57_9SPHI|nr:hypothetical protein [Sphingobacterium soli]MBA8985950.1 beta-lactam-binding protein with PASTA domain [Sphingobacterium soli]GGE28333.1 hypothetical protein GCM10011516_27510 [Sphingobacterium soli]